MKEEHVWALVSFFIFTILFSLTLTSHMEEKEYIKNGYCEQIVVGRSFPIWKKCEVNK